MGSISVSAEASEFFQPEDGKGTIRVIVADTQAIFRAGLRKIFALEDDIRVVGQAESLEQTRGGRSKRAGHANDKACDPPFGPERQLAGNRGAIRCGRERHRPRRAQQPMRPRFHWPHHSMIIGSVYHRARSTNRGVGDR